MTVTTPTTEITIDVPVGGETEPHKSLGVFHDVWVIARRGLIHMKRQPEQLSDATIQPIMFVLLFAFVFGGAIQVPGGGSYKEFLMGGIFAQTIVFSAFGVAMSIANDRKNQAVDRFRSLPIANGAVLGGHAVANLLKAFLPIAASDASGSHHHSHTGKDSAKSMFQRAYATIMDSNVTALIATVLLFWFGSGPVRGFAVTMALGIVISMFTAVSVVKVMMLSIARRRRLKTIQIKPLFGFRPVPDGTRFKFMRARLAGLGLTALLVIVRRARRAFS